MKATAKVWIALAAILTLFACSSSQKKADTGQAPAKASTGASTSSPAPKEAKAAEAKKKKSTAAAGALSCAQGTDKRKAEIHKKGDGCEVEYTKLGETKVIATSADGMDHCDEVIAKVRKNLLSSGF